MCSLLSFSRFRTLGSPPCCILAFFGDPTPTSTVTSSSGSSSWYTTTAQSGPLLLMQHLPLNFLSFFSPLCIFSFCTLTTALCSWIFLFIFCFFFPSLTPSGFFNKMLGVSEPGALNCYTLFCLTTLTLFVSRNLTSIYFPLFGSLDSMLCDLIAASPDLVFFY